MLSAKNHAQAAVGRLVQKAGVAAKHISITTQQLNVNFFQAEDGIRDLTVTGVQTCALPIFRIQTHPHVIINSQVSLRRRLQHSRRRQFQPLRKREYVTQRLAYPIARSNLTGPVRIRSEERRVGKESRSRWWQDH